MVCKSCGASVKDGQFTCSSCGAYLNKGSTIETNNIEERSALVGNSNLYSHRVPVVVDDGWKWYAFITWGLVPLFSLSAIAEIPEYFKISFAMGLISIAYVILGYFTYSSLKEFEEKSIFLLYIFLVMPIIMLFMSCAGVISNMQDKYGNSFSMDINDLLKQPKIAGVMIRNVILLVANIIYFNNRKDEFQY